MLWRCNWPEIKLKLKYKRLRFEGENLNSSIASRLCSSWHLQALIASMFSQPKLSSITCPCMSLPLPFSFVSLLTSSSLLGIHLLTHFSSIDLQAHLSFLPFSFFPLLSRHHVNNHHLDLFAFWFFLFFIHLFET